MANYPPSDLRADATILSIAAILRLKGMQRTPGNSGINLDRNNTGNCIPGLNQFTALVKADGRPGLLPGGDYRTTAPWEIEEGADCVLGEGFQTCIRPHNATYDGVVVNSHYDRTGKVRFGNMACIVAGTANPPRNKKASFVFVHASQALILPLYFEGHDIGLYPKGNCFNARVDSPRTNRILPPRVNVGIFLGRDDLPEGPTWGSDFKMYDTQVAANLTPICIAGNSGGAHLIGSSLGTSALPPTGEEDRWGAMVTLGWDYATDTASGGIGTVAFRDGHNEGPRGDRWLVRTHAPVILSMADIGFNPSAAEVGQRVKGVLKMSNIADSRVSIRDCTLGTGHFTSPDLAVFEGGGAGGDDWSIEEHGWKSASGLYVNGVAIERNTAHSLYGYSNYRDSQYPRGYGSFMDGSNGGRPMRYEGRVWSYIDQFTGALRVSTDRGATWKSITPV